MRSLYAILLLMGLLLPLLGCDGHSNDYAEYTDLPEEGWRYGDTLRFRPVHRDSICRGRLAVAVRHDNHYPYGSLWLETTVVDNGRPRKDTLELQLADRFGSWRGRGIGVSFQFADTVDRPFLHASGTPVKVRHIMRSDTLAGISQLIIFFLPE